MEKALGSSNIDDIEQEQEDRELAALSLGLSLASKAVTPNSNEMNEKLELVKKKSGYKTSSRSDALIDQKMIFSSGSSSLNIVQKNRIKILARIYKESSHTIKKIIVTGHTSTIGDGLENLKLSEARAKSVKKELIMQGVPADLVISKGYGENKLLPNILGQSFYNNRIELSIKTN